MEIRDIAVEPFDKVTDEEFKPYGQIFGITKGDASEDNEFVKCWSNNADLGSEPEVVDLCYCTLKRVDEAVMESFARKKGMPAWLEGFKGGTTVKKMERHPYTSESFFFLEGDVIFVVAPEDNASDKPDLSRARAFLCNSRHGMHLWRGTWHWPPIPVYEQARVGLVRKGKQDDFDRIDLDVELRLLV
jgi:ureidoglycolate hydrolase